MATSDIVRVVRSVVGPTQMIYNERLKDGTRSIKIGWGHNDQLDQAAKVALEAAGYTVEKVKTSAVISVCGKLMRPGTQRLHVRKLAGA